MNKARPCSLFALLFLAQATALSAQCSLESLAVSVADTAACGGPLTVTFTPVAALDTTPVVLSTWNVEGFQSDFQLEFEAGASGCYHVLTISGKYTVWSETPQFYDAFYRFDTLTNQPLLPADHYLQFPEPLFVEPPGYNPEHVYRLYYPGNGGTVVLSFSDDLYSDNWGQMTFEWSVVPCIEYTWSVPGQTATGPEFTHTFTNEGTTQLSLVAHDLYHDCTLSTWATVTIHPLPEAGVQTEPSCADEATGSAEAIPLAGTPPFLYDWGSGLSANDAASGLAPGNYALTIVDGNGCTAEVPFVIAALEPIEPQIEVAAPSCPGQDDGMATIANADPAWTYTLDGRPAVPPFTGLAPGTHTLVIAHQGGCTSAFTLDVPAPAPWWVEISGPIKPLLAGDTAHLTALLPEGSILESITWSPAGVLSCTDCLEPVARPLEGTTVTVTAVSADGCLATDSLRIEVEGLDDVYAPSAFTPNGDGVNDTFTLFAGPGFRQIRHVVVISRWGGTAWEADNLPLNDPALGWDGRTNGRPAPSSVYVWMAEVERLDGTTVLKKGSVALIR